MKRILSILLAFCLISSLTGCDTFNLALSPDKTDSSAKMGVESDYEYESFEEFLDDLFLGEVTCDSITLNYTLAHPENFGITEYEVTYGDTSLDNLDDDSATIEALTALKSFDYESLSESEQVTYDILKDYLESYLEYSDMYLYSKTLSPTIGFNSQFPVIIAEFSFRTKQDVYDYIELLSQTDEYFSYILDIEKMKSEKGLFMTDDVALKVIEQCDAFIENPDENYLIEIFNDKIDNMDDFSPDEKESLKKQNETAVKEDVIAAYSLLSEGLTDLLGTGKYEGGLCNYPDGNRYYEYLVYSSTGSSRSVDEMDDLLDSYIDGAYNDMRDVIMNNPDILNQIPDNLSELTDPYEILDDLEGKILLDFPELSDCTYTIKYVHESLEDNLSPAFYMTPAIDDYSSNSIYINRADAYAGQDLYTTLAHEGFPGHMYQICYTNSCNLHPIRSLLNYPGYSEGWATYVEMLSYDYLDTAEGISDLMKANQIATLCMYAKCDIGVNAYGWTRADVKEFFEASFGTLTDDVVDELYLCMVSEPANYLKYVIGYIEFMELRKTAEETLGKKFDAVDFHNLLLSTGPAPFDIIEKRMNEWLK